jgi:hypothetical protein
LVEQKEYRSSGVQEFRSSGVQEFRSSGGKKNSELLSMHYTASHRG